jgi:TonB family protein
MGIPPRCIVILALFVATISVAPAQETASHLKPIVVPEKEMAARLANYVAPKLPDGAMPKRCSNALVILDVDIDGSGKVSSVVVVSGFEQLGDSAQKAVTQWTYRPYEKQGLPVPVQTRVSIWYLGDGQTFPVFSPKGKDGKTLPMPPNCGPPIRVEKAPG